MKFTVKTFTIISFLAVLLSSAYALVDTEPNKPSKPVQSGAKVRTEPVDTTAKPSYRINNLKQDTYDELGQKYAMDAPVPDNIKSSVEYDPSSGNYLFRTTMGEMDVVTPFSMTSEQYQRYSAQQEMTQYWKEKNAQEVKNNEDKFSLTDMKFNIGPADKIFGPGGVQLRTQGSAELIYGYKVNKIENPSLTERMRKTGTFNFDEKIQLNVNGSVGDKLKFGLNYNTESSFDFDQKMVKLAYKGKEDEIIKSIEAGNVSMQLNSSLISGNTALFGVKTDLQFGRLSVSAIATQQQSQTQTVNSQGGAQTTKFEVSAANYDENRHFFLSQYFRDNFEKSMSRLPLVASGVTINRIEVWVTNKRASYDQARNVLAFMDLGETDKRDNSYWNVLLAKSNPANRANTLYGAITGIDGVRNIQNSNKLIAEYASSNSISDFYGGEDYEKIESARKLEPTEYTLNRNLGFISLRTALNPDEVLAVSYEYTSGGEVYQVGEFSTDEIKAPEALVVKLLKGTNQNPKTQMWNLMMKNVYDLGAYNVQKDNFKLNVVYRNDSVGTEMQYLTEGQNTANKLLLRVLNLDRLDARNEANPDGVFDFVDGYTIQPSNGRLIFPVLEPFGEYLGKQIDPSYDKTHPANSTLASKYVYQELYDSTSVVAQEFSEKNKFSISGQYKASSGSEIRLNATNIPRGSVTVTAGGATLVENVDYTVDYTMGTVTIINQSLVESGTNISVQLENQNTFNLQRKSLVGTHLEYKFNKDFTLGGTIMHLSETPLTTKVNSGSEPISNTIWGMNTSWRTESQLLTNVLDKLPFVNATKPSTIALNAEFAQLIPGHSSVVGKEGLAYIDDFEATQTKIDIHYPVNWRLASAPTGGLFPEAALSNNVDYGKNRALLAWYYVDPLFNESRSYTPDYIRNDDVSKSNHLTRVVLEQEVFPNKTIDVTKSPRLTVMNLSYYPDERGPYNVDVNPTAYSKGMNPANGRLLDPKTRWGGIMRKLDVTDFENSNIEYLEFWMMDPFITDKNNSNPGGELYFNLGDISEDIQKDGKKFFEQGLPVDGDVTRIDTTVWGRIPKVQSTVTAFTGDRSKQDVGYDGLANSDEFGFPTYQKYISEVKAKVTAQALDSMMNDAFSSINDPAGDNYHFYRGTDYDNEKLNVLTRYKRYNGVEGNSPDVNQTKESYSTTATSLPDQEDINMDNTLNEYEKYYQYKVSINRDSMIVGKNHITDVVKASVEVINSDNKKEVQEVKWYQFKIPVREYDDKFGSIRNFKSIRFIRMFMTDFEQATTLRLATLDLVRGEWRKYSKDLMPTGEVASTNGEMNVQAVNIEENANKTPVNYVLPPGVTRETDPGQPALLQLNEQAMVLQVNNLAKADARAVYRTLAYDMRRYKRLQMFVHAEKMLSDVQTLNDGDLTCFIRLGSDMVNNYYEYEIPLRVTPAGIYSDDTSGREAVWIPDNMFDFPFEVLTKVKQKRNRDRQNSGGAITSTKAYSDYDPDKPMNKITVKGNPSISDVENIMIGVRNASNSPKSGEVWVNELRLSQFNEDGGWAAMSNLAVGLSDLGSVNVAGRVETSGYGSIESNVANRRLDDLYQFNFSTTLDLGRFLPEQAKLKIPAYFSYSNETTQPKYNPMDEDVLLSDALSDLDTNAAKDSLKQLSQVVNTTKSFNITGAKVNIRSKKPQFYDPANVAVTYAYNQTNEQTPSVEKNMTQEERLGLNYSYSFNTKPVEPFRKVKLFQAPAFALIKDFNFNYLPASVSYNTNMERQLTLSVLRDLTSNGTSQISDPTYSRQFLWNRQFDIKYDLTKALKLSLQTAMNSSIEEPQTVVPEIGMGTYEMWRDSVWSNIRRMGTPYTYQQVFTASWAVPVNKIPLFGWVTSNVSYNSNYNWNRTASVTDTDGKKVNYGNTAVATGAWQGDFQLNFETLYNNVKYLKDVNQRYSATVTKQKFQSKTYVQRVNLIKNKSFTLNHRLGSEKFKLTAVDKGGRPVTLDYKVKNSTSVDIMPSSTIDSLLVTVETLDPNLRTPVQTAVDFTARTLMMLRKASATYRQTNTMTLTGYSLNPGLFNQPEINGSKSFAYLFSFGIFDDNTLTTLSEDGYLYKDENVVNPATKAFTSDLDLKATVEPIPGLKIDLNARRYEGKNTSYYYMYDGIPQTFSGSYNMTTVAISTAFKKIGGASTYYTSDMFEHFLANRQVVASRLNGRLTTQKYPNSGFLNTSGLGGQNYNAVNGSYGLNSADVLIPSFIAAYTGRDASSMSTSPFMSLLSALPNWRITYDGLSKLPFVKEYLKSVSLTHAYTCRYSIGNYTSYSTWVGDINSGIGFVSDVSNDSKAIPSSPYNITDVSLNEQFSPLLGVNVVLKNSVTGKVELRKQRNMVLNISSTQLVESLSDEYVFGMGYVLKDFDVILKLKNDKQSKVKNDLKLNADVSYKDIKSLLRKVQENITQASSGNKVFTLKVTADYVFSSKLNIQLFYDRQSSTPLVSSSFPVSSSNFGMSMKFMLTR